MKAWLKQKPTVPEDKRLRVPVAAGSSSPTHQKHIAHRCAGDPLLEPCFESIRDAFMMTMLMMMLFWLVMMMMWSSEKEQTCMQKCTLENLHKPAPSISAARTAIAFVL